MTYPSDYVKKGFFLALFLFSLFISRGIVNFCA
jgi:hypothetical protein